jgi:RHS repeat-associated protein
MWQLVNNYTSDIRQYKHVYVGETRIATKINLRGETGISYESVNQYWYHSDHLGSAQLVTNTSGQVHEHIEYTPYGELWIEEVTSGVTKLPFRFTGKEIDEETGLYYYGARYLDPKYSRWLSPDPALGEYIPSAPVNEEAKKRNGNLPGMGGVFNLVNLHLYHYAGNNPVKFTDPDGRENKDALGIDIDQLQKTLDDDERPARTYLKQGDLEKKYGYPKNSLCNATSILNMYIDEGSIDKSIVDKVMTAAVADPDGSGLKKDGEVVSAKSFSNLIATKANLNHVLHEDLTPEGLHKALTQNEFMQTDSKYGIVKDVGHFETAVNEGSSVRIINPGQNKYKFLSIRPFISIPRKKE